MRKPLAKPLDTRLEIRVTADTPDRLERLALKTKVRSYGEVVRNALDHYESFVNKRKPG